MFSGKRKTQVIHALIPARGGSKGIPRKNIKLYKKIPLLVHSILLAKKCSLIDRVVVSTDDLEIKQIAEKHGAEVPFLRPKEIAGDYSLDIECFQHYLQYLQKQKAILPTLLVHLRPTYPERSLSLLEKSLKKFLQICHKYDSLRSVIPIEKSAFKMYLVEKKELKPLFPTFKTLKEPYNQVRQALPKCYLHNGCIDIVNTKTILSQKSMTGKKIYPWVMKDNENYDLDTMKDWQRSLKQEKDSDSEVKHHPIPNGVVQDKLLKAEIPLYCPHKCS